MTKRITTLLLVLLMALSCAAVAETGLGGVADAADMTDVIDVVEPGMEPVAGDRLNDGTYEVAVDCSSSMFKIVGCALTVEDGAMTAKLTMKSDAYLYLYPGTAEDAAASEEADLLALRTEGEEYFFTFPVPALDAGVDCAAYSARKALWYPRTLLFRADSLPAEAWREDDLRTAESLGLADGAYLVDVSLEGGRAKLLSPAVMNVAGGVCAVTLVFATTKIDYVIVDDEKVLPVEVPDGLAFTVPVAAFDRGLALIVDSTAIKPATEVAYTFTLDSASIERFDQ